MSIRHTCQGSPQQSSPSNCVACDLMGVGSGQSAANYGQPYGPQPGGEAPRYVRPHGNAVHPDVAWMNQTLASAPRNPFNWREEPLNDRYGMQGGAPSPGPRYPYPTSINISGPRGAAPPAGGDPRQPAQTRQVAGQQSPPDLGQAQQCQTPAHQQNSQQEEAVPPSTKNGKARSKESHRSRA
ncbi:hypothetical protein KC343_g4280 [Hortaea werneckii]|nr:hypothetical protein KC352_g17015 [Hortaea werneckii]KAI7614727.1 hypothetical protein KC346_g6814 [Hortaea werneckii]KAI7631036.1 hypothetical protein KC343_g4280 [Hortaea werneckii]KAI7706556.1 hypothetical protein KC322_g5838 [Hortaea werneckii]